MEKCSEKLNENSRRTNELHIGGSTNDRNGGQQSTGDSSSSESDCEIIFDTKLNCN